MQNIDYKYLLSVLSRVKWPLVLMAVGVPWCLLRSALEILRTWLGYRRKHVPHWCTPSPRLQIVFFRTCTWYPSWWSAFSLLVGGNASRLNKGLPSRRYTPKYLSLKIPCPAYTIFNISFLNFQSIFVASIPLGFERGFPVREMVQEKVDQRSDKELQNPRRSSTHFNPIVFPLFWSRRTVPLHFCLNHPDINEIERNKIHFIFFD